MELPISAPLARPKDGESLDGDDLIQTNHCKNQKEFDYYFSQKEKSINDYHGKMHNESAMHSWSIDENLILLVKKDWTLLQLKVQKSEHN
jgi:hypothetical protein